MIRYIKKKFTRLARWLDYNPPGALTSKGWRLFKNEFKEKAPIRYWITHDLKHKCVWPIKWKYNKISDWIRYRTIHRYHIVNTGLEPGYYDNDTTILHANFSILKDFVEVEQAWHKYCWGGLYKNAGFFEKYMPFYRVFFPFRDPKLGVECLEWAATLDDPSLPPHERCDHQAIAAREILALYRWWTIDRPNRQEIEYLEYDNQGLDMLAVFDEDFDRDAPDYKAAMENMDARTKQEEEWKNEEEEMLIRLIKVRKHLWT